jgi:hypothetical protein
MNLTPERLVELRSRFVNFYDGVVATVDLQLRHGPRRCVLTVHCRDTEGASGWSAIVFTMSGVDEFRFELGRYTFEVLSFGIQFAWKNELLYMVLAPNADETEDLPDLTENIAYVSGTSCEYEILPLS